MNRLRRFLCKKYRVSDIPFQSLTPDFVSAYDFCLRVDLKFAQATIVNTNEYLRKIVKSAINNGLIQHDPFIDYKYDSVPIIPKSLTEKELKKIIKTPQVKPNLSLVRDMFVFMCFTFVALIHITL